jgi:predicted Fe-Mo cluster-binding NifX family protein
MGPWQDLFRVMKIAVASSGKWLDCAVDEHTGRAAFFIVYDTDQETFEAVENWDSRECIHWAGPRTAEALARVDADALVVRRIGPSAFRKLTDAGIDVYFVDAVTAVDAIRRFREGTLPRAEAPNCPGHGHHGDSRHPG